MEGVGPRSLSFRVRFPARSPRRRRRRRPYGIRSSRGRPRLGGASLRCRRRARGGVVRRCRLYRSPGRASSSSPAGGRYVGLLSQGGRTGCGSCGVLVVGPSSSFPRWRRLSTASLGLGAEELGAPPRSMGERRRLHPVSCDGCLLRLLQSQRAMGFFQLLVSPVVFLVGGGRRRRLQAPSDYSGPRDFVAIFFSFRVLCEVWLAQQPLYPCRTLLYVYENMYAFLI